MRPHARAEPCNLAAPLASFGDGRARSLGALFSVDPSRVAVVLVDFQNDLCAPGAFGADPPNNAANAATAHRANEFARAAIGYGAKAIYTRQVHDDARLDERQRRWERQPSACRMSPDGRDLFIEPVPGAGVVDKARFDIWRSAPFVDALEASNIDGLVIAGVDLSWCVLYAVLGAAERGYPYVVPQDLVSGLDTCEQTSNRAVREFLRRVHPSPESSHTLLRHWAARAQPRT
jgi:nicotinamidase-related amidase